MCRIALAVGVVNIGALITGFKSMACDNNSFHEHNKGIRGSFSHLHGWGYATLTNEGLRTYRTCDPLTNDTRFNDLVSEKTPLLLHTRRATVGGLKTSNNHPFIGLAGGDTWAFVHNGTLQLKRRTNNLLGSTDSEEFFSVLLDHLNSYGVKEAVIRARMEVDYYSGLNFVLLSKKHAYVHVAYTKHPEYYTMRLLNTGEGVIISSEEITEFKGGWERIPNNCLIKIDLQSNSLDATLLNDNGVILA